MKKKQNVGLLGSLSAKVSLENIGVTFSRTAGEGNVTLRTGDGTEFEFSALINPDRTTWKLTANLANPSLEVAKGPLQGTYRMEGISYDMVADIARGMLSVAAGPGDDLPWEASGEGGGFPPGKKRKKR